MAKVEFFQHAASYKSAAHATETVPDHTGPVVEWGWHVKADNGEIVAGGEGHRDKTDARRAFLTAAQAMNEAVVDLAQGSDRAVA